MDNQKFSQTSTTPKLSGFGSAVSTGLCSVGEQPNRTGNPTLTVEASSTLATEAWGCSAGISPNPCPVLLSTKKEGSKVANQPTERNCSTGIRQNPCPVGFSETKAGLDSRGSNTSNGCSAGISPNSYPVGASANKEENGAASQPTAKFCSAGISQNLCPIELSGNKGEWGVASQPTSKVCSAGIRQNPCSVEVSATQSQLEVEERPKRRSQIQTQKWKLRRLIIPAEQKPLITEPDCFSEKNDLLTTFTRDDPPNPDDFDSDAAYLKAGAEWELQDSQVAETPIKRESQTIPAEQKPHIPAEQNPETETLRSPRTRNTKLGRGSCPKQLNCNVKRNGSKGKSPNTYWVYQFSFKVDGKYFKRSCSIPKDKVNRVIEMWESQEYSWREIVEYIGKTPDKIVAKARKQKDI